MGRADRVLCLIVSGEPYSSAVPGQETEECFPQAIRYQLDSKGEISDTPAEPLAADVRPGKDGKQDALLKVISGILDIGFDRLKQREARRKKMRRIQWSFGTVRGMLLFATGYLLMADMGISLPWRDAIQRELDKREPSVMRAVPSDRDVISVAKAMHLRVSDAIHKAREESGWISQSLKQDENEILPHDLASHSQSVFALCDSKQRGVWDNNSLFASTRVPYETKPENPIPLFQETYDPPEISWKPSDSCGAFWLICMLASANHSADIVPENMKLQIREYARHTQQILEPYRTDLGGWRMFPGAEQTAPANAYSAALALLALLECRNAGLPWLDSENTRDEMLRSTALWLQKNFYEDEKAAGWRGTGENRYEVFDGLTLQV